MEQMTMRIKPKEVNKYTQVVSRFGWVETSRVEIFDKGVDLGAYTPIKYKSKYKGKLVLVTFERDPNNKRYADYKKAEGEYLSKKLYAIKKPTANVIIVGLVFIVAAVAIAVVGSLLAWLAGMGLRALAQTGADYVNGFVQFLATIAAQLSQLLSFFGIEIDPSTWEVDSTSIGRVAGLVGLLAVAVPTYSFCVFVLIIPAIVMLVIGFLVLFVRIIVFAVRSGKNKKVGKEHQIIFDELEAKGGIPAPVVEAKDAPTVKVIPQEKPTEEAPKTEEKKDNKVVIHLNNGDTVHVEETKK